MQMSVSLEVLKRCLQYHPEIKTLYLGFSGGLDSMALLHLLANEAALQTLDKVAIHVNHGLSPNAKQWEDVCEQSANQHQFTYISHRVQLTPQAGESLENLARIERYGVFKNYIDAQSLLLTAHHQDDQAETFLLQCLRGAGVKGLSSMPVITSFAEGYHCRPLLHHAREDLEAYSKHHQLSWIEDESNFDISFDRNYIRHRIMPLLKHRWPGAGKTIARSAKHCSEATTTLSQLAEHDWNCVAQGIKVNLEELFVLPKARQTEVIRYGLRLLRLPGCSERIMNELLATMQSANPDANPVIIWPGAEVRRYLGQLYFLSPLQLHKLEPLNVIVGEEVLLQEQQVKLVWHKARGGLALKEGESLTLQYRQGGERFHPFGRQGSHPLKKLMQEWRIEPWLRSQVPLLYKQQQLIAVVDYGIADEYSLASSELGWHPSIETFSAEEK